MIDTHPNPRQKAQEILFAWFAFQRSLGQCINCSPYDMDVPVSSELIIQLLADIAAQLENFPDIIAGTWPYHDEAADDTALTTLLRQECMGIHIRLQTLYLPARWVNPLGDDHPWRAWKQFCDLIADYTDTKRIYGEFVCNDLSTSQWREILLRLVDPSRGKIFNSPRILRWLGVTSTWVKLHDFAITSKPSKPFSPNETDNAFLQRKAHERKAAEGPFIKLGDRS